MGNPALEDLTRTVGKVVAILNNDPDTISQRAMNHGVFVDLLNVFLSLDVESITIEHFR